ARVASVALGNPVLPGGRGDLQCKALGMAVVILDVDGRRLASGKGELVCTRHFPSIPLSFWNDPDGTMFHYAYFSSFPGVWAHG
ncbi:acetoacetate--CoA ligase, partial [Pseudomonas aeruginosa]